MTSLASIALLAESLTRAPARVPPTLFRTIAMLDNAGRYTAQADAFALVGATDRARASLEAALEEARAAVAGLEAALAAPPYTGGRDE